MNAFSVDMSLAGFEDIREDVEAFCEARGLPLKTGFSLQLVLEELVVNIVNHGYEGREGPVRLRLDAAGGLVTAELADEGRPFDPTAAPDVDVEAGLDERPIGGLGVHLVRSMVDSLDYERVGRTNVLRFTLRIPEDEQAGETV